MFYCLTSSLLLQQNVVVDTQIDCVKACPQNQLSPVAPETGQHHLLFPKAGQGNPVKVYDYKKMVMTSSGDGVHFDDDATIFNYIHVLYSCTAFMHGSIDLLIFG